MSHETGAVVLKPHELYCLASLMHVPHLVGVEDPFFGLLADEAEQLLDDTVSGMIDNNILQRRGNGNLALDSGVAVMVHALGFAPRTLLVSLAAGSGPNEVLYIHWTQAFLVEQQGLPHDRVALSLLQDLEAVHDRVRDFVRLPSVPAGHWVSGLYSDSALLTAGRAVSRTPQVPATPIAAKGGGAVPEPLLEILSHAHVGSLVILHRAPEHMHYGASVAWVVGPEGGWRIESAPIGEGVLRLTPAAADDILQRLARIVAVLPESEG